VPVRWIVLLVFIAFYAFLIFSKHHRAKGIWIAVGLMALGALIFGKEGEAALLSPRALLTDAVNWNVIGVLAGAMLIADLFIESRVPVLLSDLIALRCRTVHMALLGVCALAGFISAFVDNVTTVLIVAPVALAIAKRTDFSPVPLLVGIAVCSNLQGAATLIGDPPSMMLAGFYKMSFNDFFVYRSRPSIFFAIQLGAVAGLFVLYLIFRKQRRPMVKIEIEKPLTWVPVGFIVAMIAFLASSSRFDPGFRWLAGTGNVCLGAAALAWATRRNRAEARKVITRYEFPTIAFLAGIFVMAYAMNQYGWVDAIARGISGLVGHNEFVAYTVIVWFSVFVSAFIDNIAYVAVMLPVTQQLGEAVGGPPFLYAAGLLIGACLGGNITPIGAACNVVATGILRREGRPISFWQFARIGLPFTLAATGAGYVFVWIFWH
jgi:Na+/H+ antiporter NhaD/arsenite permease-like protein